jgi:general secretion pathway protein A
VYESYWELSEPPFDNSPNPKFFYRSPEHEEALARLEYAVTHRKGFAMLTGDYGCGKTTLARALFRRLDGARYEVGFLTNPGSTPIDFLREVLYQLGVDAPDKAKPDLLHLLNDLFYRNFQAGRDSVVLVDEAQMIGEEAVFEELRLLANFQTDERFLVTVLLIGSNELREKVRRIRPLDQRMAVRYHLHALDLAHTANYIAHRLKAAGQARTIFTDDAVKLVFDFTRGTPREINTLCDISLLVGYSKRLREIDERTVAEVIKDTVGVS